MFNIIYACNTFFVNDATFEASTDLINNVILMSNSEIKWTFLRYFTLSLPKNDG